MRPAPHKAICSAGYINEANPRAGYYFSFAWTLIGAMLMYLVSWPDDSNITGDCDPCACPPLVGTLGGPLAGPLAGHLGGHVGCAPGTVLGGHLGAPSPCLQYPLACDLPPPTIPLRASRSVPEGLYRPPARHVTVIEQITTSV